jgi:hypothetical protein
LNFAQHLAIGMIRVVVRLIQLFAMVVLGVTSLAGIAVMAVLGLVVLAFMAAEDEDSQGSRRPRCAGPSWSVAAVR